MASLEAVAASLQQAQKLFLSGHVMPDGDSLGSVLALGMALQQMGKQVVMASPDPLPELYRFLPGAEQLVSGERGLGRSFDTLVALDCSVPERLGIYRQYLEHPGLKVLVLDHHVGRDNFAHQAYCDSRAAATGEIVLDLLDLLPVRLTPDMATCLYVAIVTDTGSFQYDSTSPGTLRRAARLLEHGVQAAAVSNQLYAELPLGRLVALQSALNTLQITAGGRVAWAFITREVMEEKGVTEESMEGLINHLRSIKGVEVAVFFYQLASGHTKVGLRSKSRVDVNQLAGRFGGGGHVRAAGCTLSGDMQQIMEKVVAAAVEAVGAGD